MNSNIIKKCIEELRKPKTNKQYVLGMLEAMSEMPERAEVPERAKFIEKPDESPRVGFDDFEEIPVIPPKLPATVIDPTGDIETPEQRKMRLNNPKVPPAFLGEIRRMNLDPSLTDGKTDVTPNH